MTALQNCVVYGLALCDLPYACAAVVKGPSRCQRGRGATAAALEVVDTGVDSTALAPSRLMPAAFEGELCSRRWTWKTGGRWPKSSRFLRSEARSSIVAIVGHINGRVGCRTQVIGAEGGYYRAQLRRRTAAPRSGSIGKSDISLGVDGVSVSRNSKPSRKLAMRLAVAGERWR